MSESAKESIEITKSKLLLVEGIDEQFAFEKLFDEINISNVQVISYKGKDNLFNKLDAIIDTPGSDGLVNSIGITRDADEDAIFAFTSIANTLNKLGLAVPVGMNQVCEKHGISISVFILPDCSSSGMLENLFVESIKDTPIFDVCIDEFLNLNNS